MPSVIKKYGPEGHEFGVLLREGNEKVYETHRTRKAHFMRKYEAWGIEESVVKDLVYMGCDKVHIIVKAEGVLETTVRKFIDEGILTRYEPFGEQYFLPEVFFKWLRRDDVRSLDAFA